MISPLLIAIVEYGFIWVLCQLILLHLYYLDINFVTVTTTPILLSLSASIFLNVLTVALVEYQKRKEFKVHSIYDLYLDMRFPGSLLILPLRIWI